jgi:hypothetical protein
MRRLLTLLVWVATALAVTAVGAGAVNLVTSQVNDPPAAPLTADALEALSDATAPAGIVSTTTDTTGTSAPVMDPNAPDAPLPDVTTSSAPDQTDGISPAPTVTIGPASTTTTTVEAPPSDEEATGLRSFTLIGGTVLIEVLDDGIAWRSSTPHPGFAVRVDKSGPELIVVEFEATNPDDDRTSTFEAKWDKGRLEWEIEESDEEDD